MKYFGVSYLPPSTIFFIIFASMKFLPGEPNYKFWLLFFVLKNKENKRNRENVWFYILKNLENKKKITIFNKEITIFKKQQHDVSCVFKNCFKKQDPNMLNGQLPPLRKRSFPLFWIPETVGSRSFLFEFTVFQPFFYSFGPAFTAFSLGVRKWLTVHLKAYPPYICFYPVTEPQTLSNIFSY